MHEIAQEIRNCKDTCFKNRYLDGEYKNKIFSKKQMSSIKPLVYAPDKPKILLISQAPSLQAWLNGLNNKFEDGGLVSEDNEFLINDLLPAFGLTKNTLNIFKKNVFWIHSCNCYPFFKRNTKGTRRDYHPNKTQVNKCL